MVDVGAVFADVVFIAIAFFGHQITPRRHQRQPQFICAWGRSFGDLFHNNGYRHLP
jgi:hypothetical protein